MIPSRREQEVEFAKLAKRLRRNVGRAIEDYNLIEAGDRVMVCLSGGKDSYTLLDILLELQRKAPVAFHIRAVNLDQKQPGFPAHVLPEYLRSRGVEYDIIEQDTYSIVKRVIPEGRTTCGLCSRLRRGILYRYAAEHGMTRIALGHHRDDILATLFLNLFHGGSLKAMPPKLLSDDGRHVVIRPLALCREIDIARYAEARAFPIIPCTLCGSQEHLERRRIREMLDAWQRESPKRIENLFNAIGNVKPSHLMDPTLHDFRELGSRAKPAAGWLVPAPDTAEEEAESAEPLPRAASLMSEFED
ncbi:MAG TPA: tRNA 2-thiocytidine(32) synthetase TtcA [Gammaproteobacteria bacterium]|nr:tRNA 2-thiocytidine(32) synthetase TtcA [Gammaproteobacteria bacterium]